MTIETEESNDFSIVLGGPLYQFFLRLHVARPSLELLLRRIIFLSMAAWVPLLILAIAWGRAWGGVKVTFLYDVAAHARFLISLPLLIAAELVVHRRISPLIEQFVARDMIKPHDRDRFHQIIVSSRRWRNSVIAEVILVILVFTGGQALWRTQGALGTSTWYADTDAGGTHLTIAGICYAYWSLPVYQFIVFRWYFRLLIWGRFLFKVSRLDLNVIPTHPDYAGGLGFLAGSAYALMPLMVAQSVTISGVLANRIFFDGANLMQFKYELLVLELFTLVLALGPMTVFAPVLLRCQRIGNREYGLFASKYVGEFDEKWLRTDAHRDEMLGTGDIQSLADLGNSFDVIRSMSPFPFSKRTAIQIVVATALPVLPLVLTVIPLDQLVDRLFRSLL
jgi:hypothetical protein